MEPHPCKNPVYLPQHNSTKPVKFFYQFSLDVLLLRKWQEYADAYRTPLSSNEAKHWEKPADIVVVPSLYSRMWRCPLEGPPKAGYSGTNWTMPYPDMGEARAYWDRLRTTYCRGLEGSLEQSPSLIAQ